MSFAIALILKPLVALLFIWGIGAPVVRLVGKMEDGKLKRFLLTRVSKD
jgi:hypothetical protein